MLLTNARLSEHARNVESARDVPPILVVCVAEVPALSWKSVNRVRTIAAVIIMIAAAFNKPLGKLISDTWQGVPGKYVLTLVAVFILWEVMLAVYTERQERSAALDVALAKAKKEAAEAKATMYDGRPLLVFDIVHQPKIMAANTVGRTIFQLKNCGGRPARWVKLHSIKSNGGKYLMDFEPIPLVDTKGEAAVQYSVNFTGHADERWLWQ